jgi:ABC-type Fe3+ transport system substrate-binding protein
MKIRICRIVYSVSFVVACLVSVQVFAAPAPSLQKAKQEAEAKGLTFFANHDEIVAKAKKEGKIRVLSSLDPESFKPMADSFKKKYPFADVEVQELTGTEAIQRFLLELKSGTARDWDVVHASEDFYNDFVPHTMKFDILGMAEQGILKIQPKMVDPVNRTIVAIGSAICAMAYNRNRIPDGQAPNQLEDLLKPEFKGKKFFVDIRPHCMAALMAGLGEEWVLNYARKIKDQDPVWTRGNTRALTAIATGEHSLHQLTNYHSCVRATWKDKQKSLVCKVVEPVSVRIQEPEFIAKTSASPHVALLFLEHESSPEGQKVLDQIEPLKSSIFTGGEISKAIQGKKVSINDFRTYHNTPEWMKKIVEAYGFPKAQR